MYMGCTVVTVSTMSFTGSMARLGLSYERGPHDGHKDCSKHSRQDPQSHSKDDMLLQATDTAY